MWRPIRAFIKFRRVRRMNAQRQLNPHQQRFRLSQSTIPQNRQQRNRLRVGIPSAVRDWLRKDGWAIGGTLFLVALTTWYFGFYTQKFHLKDVTIEGAQFIPAEDVRTVVDRYLNSRIFGVAPRNTFWTMRADAMELSLTEQFSETYALESIDVEKDFPDTLIVKIVERIPQVTWVTSLADQEGYYTVDREGRVTQVLTSTADARSEFPVVRDVNRDVVEVGTQIISAEYIAFLMQIHEQLPGVTGLSIASYEFPAISCQEKQYVAEKVFEQEILDSASEEFREKKRAIQEKFQQGLLTVDQSLDALELVKQEELVNLGQVSDQSGHEALQWATTYVAAACDYVTVGHDLHVITTEESGSFAIYMDSTVDPLIQIENARSLLVEKISDRTQIRYIDVRLIDRAYYQ